MPFNIFNLNTKNAFNLNVSYVIFCIQMNVFGWVGEDV